MGPTADSRIEPTWPVKKDRRSSDRFRAEQIRMLYRSGPVGVVAASVGAFALAAVVVNLGARSLPTIQIWLVFIALISGVHLYIARAYHLARSQVSELRRWARWFTIMSFAEGLIWGVTAIYTSGPNQFDQQLVTMCLVVAVTSGAVSAYGVYVPAFCAIFFPATVPFVVVTLLQGRRPIHYLMASLTLIFIAGTFIVGLRYNANLQDTLRLRFENLDLANDLRLQKEAPRRLTFRSRASLPQPVMIYASLSMLSVCLSAHCADIL